MLYVLLCVDIKGCISMSKMRVTIFLVSFCCVFLAGCTQMSRQMGQLTSNKFADPRSGSVWVVPPEQLEPPSSDRKTAYISYRNISDASIDLIDVLKEAAREQGWQLTNDPNKAQYRLRVSTRFFGEVEPESGGAKEGAALGGIAGAAVGITSGVATARATDSGLAGFGVGAIAGSLVAAGISNASRPREWALIMDVVLEERMSKPVTFTVNAGNSTQMGDRAGASSSRMSSSGGTNQTNNREASATRTSNYFPHGARLSVWSNQMNMSEEEAVPHIMERTRRVVTQMLPM